MSRKHARSLGHKGALHDELYKEMITELGPDMMMKAHRECSGRTKRDIELD